MEQQRGSQLAAETVEREFSNVTLLGRAAGRRFFTKDVLLHAWSAA
jgi:hypothetical protein